MSVRLILATSLLVAGAVFASAWYSQAAIRDVARADAKTRRSDGMDAIDRESALLARNVEGAVSTPLAGGALDDVPPLLAAAVRDYPRIQWLLVIDPAHKVVASTRGAPAPNPDKSYRDELSDKLDADPPGKVERSGADTQWTYGSVIRSGDRVVGQVRVGVSTAELEAGLAHSIAAADETARQAGHTALLVALIVLGVGVIASALQGWSMSRPLHQLAVQAERIAQGQLDQRVPDRRGDEIGLLARNFNFMAGRLGELLIESAQKASLEREMSLARQVQQAMLPTEELIDHGGVRLAGHCVPASSCGGDWWTFRKLSGGRTLVVIGDATGHGLHSALIAATARGAVEALADADERLLTPEGVLKAIHSAISGIGDHSLLMTCFAAVIDPADATIHYANAGQNFPYVMRRGGDGALDEAQIIAASGNPLGDPQVPQSLRRGSVPMHAGDVLVTFTDGVVERQNPMGKLFGDRRLRACFTGQVVDGPEDLSRLRERVVASVEAFADGTTSQDDVTFVLVLHQPAQGKRLRTAS